MKPDGTPYFVRRLDRAPRNDPADCCHSQLGQRWGWLFAQQAAEGRLRGKLACFACRRTFRFLRKPDTEYAHDAHGGRLARPHWTRLRAVHRAAVALQHTDPARSAALARAGRELEEALFGHGGTALPPQAELDALKPWLPAAWWRRVVPCCPGCGAAGVPVSSAFEAPPRGDVRAWRAARAWVEGGGEAALREGRWAEARLRGRWALPREVVEGEKRRRIETLRRAVELGVRTSEEERRLGVIRARKGKVEEEAWAVVVDPGVIALD
ncbi:hypothetical protein PsYK624_147400 [Phanerochaete sordida]|uniref:Uncharacterized protein n=1 Tax=Phanerochaete sordida TaxID=48140 RepID=A0A9P3GMG3_9APHY|nr:hypothetical protein PsYK624_147400 [Phanerochaete sordida]